MAEVLCVHRQVKLLNKAAAVSKKKPNAAVVVISYMRSRASRPYQQRPGFAAQASTFSREHELLQPGFRPISSKGAASNDSRCGNADLIS
jgi:hypothetical protein